MTTNTTTTPHSHDDLAALENFATAAGSLMDRTLLAVLRRDPQDYAALQTALYSGAMVTASTTCSPAGLAHVVLEVLLPSGERIPLLDFDLTAQAGPDLHPKHFN